MTFFPSEFTAIDFETANRNADSACSVGLVTVSGGEIVDQQRFLIRPRPMIFEPGNIRIHRITPDMVRHEKTWEEVWPLMLPYLQTGVWAAHNAGFDMKVMATSLASRQMPFPTANYFCTVRTSKKVWPGLKGYSLGALAQHFDYELNHHEALSDARVCARLALRAIKDAGITSERTWKQAGLALHSFGDLKRKTSDMGPQVAQLSSDPLRDFDSFSGKTVVLTGNLMRLTRDEAEDWIVKMGGNLSAVVSESTDYLIWGKWNEGPHILTTKLNRADDLRKKGHQIRILDEAAFLKIIENTFEKPLFTV